ncbi:alanine racemase [Aliikangiella sp. IMCC44632]
MRSTKAIIDLAAIRHNLSVVKRLAPAQKVMAVLKADAYGHGIIQTAKAMPQVDALAVACMDEAIRLRKAGIDNEIILLEGCFSAAEYELVLKHQLQTVVHHQAQIDIIEAAASTTYKPVVWLKLDTGMNRLGFTQTEFEVAFQQLSSSSKIAQINLMSHFACADDITNSFSQQQLLAFKRAVSNKSAKLSMANSAGIVAWPESHFDWVRPGIILYGCSPMLGLKGEQHSLKPAMTLESQLFAVKDLKPGDTVGYGATWRAKQATRVGIIAIGYGDGYPRHAKQGTPVLINGTCYPLIGKVSMDMISVDLGKESTIPMGSRAVLWGKDLPIETIAKHADTISYTLLCGVTSRVRFEWLE